MRKTVSMVHSIRFTCLLDTNVLFPLEIRDILLWFAYYELFTPKWSEDIFQEWITIMRNKNIPEEIILNRIDNVDKAFPDAKVINYQALIETLDLPDPKDRHVLAAAIKSNANIIVTNNLRDFPYEYLESFELKALSVDDFLTDIIDLNPTLAIAAFKQMVINRTNPAMDEFTVLDILRKRGLTNTANYLHSQL